MSRGEEASSTSEQTNLYFNRQNVLMRLDIAGEKQYCQTPLWYSEVISHDIQQQQNVLSKLLAYLQRGFLPQPSFCADEFVVGLSKLTVYSVATIYTSVYFVLRKPWA